MICKLIKIIQQLGSWFINYVRAIGQALLILLLILRASTSFFKYFSLFIHQVYFLAVLSLPIIIFSGLAVGMVLALQGQYVLSQFGSEELVGLVATLSLIRELAPVLTSLLFIGRACSAITAEIGLMRSTEQLDALELMAIDPYKYVFFPRFLTGVVVVPLLNAIFIATGVLGAALVGVYGLGIDEGSFWNRIQAAVSWDQDILRSIIKALVFGTVAIWIAIYQGLTTALSAAGVSNATTQTVVIGSLSVLLLDFVLTAIMFV